MLNWKQQLMKVVIIGFVWGAVGLLTPTASQAQFFGQFAPLEQLTESGCVDTPAWDEIFEGPRRWVEKMDGAAYCDRQTGLVWEAAPSDQKWTWSEAIEHCLNRTVGENGQLGWRLPLVQELASLVDGNSFSCQDDQLCLPDFHPFQNVQSDEYWSASQSSPVDFAATVKFDIGAVDRVPKPIHLPAWCVRGG